MLPALSDYTRLLDTFLAGRNPRTLAAYQADLEDFRRFVATLSGSPPTLAAAMKQKATNATSTEPVSTTTSPAAPRPVSSSCLPQSLDKV